MTWNPDDHTQGLRIISSLPLPAGIAGLTDGHTIWLNPALTPTGRRCTLAHELIHVERGIIHHLPNVLAEREERTVDRIAAHRLITIDDLVTAIVWAQGDGDRHGIATDVDVDLSTLDVRLRTVTDDEAAAINRALDELGQVA
ncbi:ImmA/IrrE family metallo-endopeptidase [Corynebacterium hansenii]|uniref:ImmA/IrrE family metallo-endopeptidase n=1 Tax=Corynebacterium hansenii TaxID=394964 RepID=A0ABV7ZNY1_9CORY|nr:ImmA/IrrE family metallo-endopeptidase [Corynebacterium hansenii]WJY99318.1 hypothetical protein CHAN_03450 [Corynebacterium hansenii]